MVRNSASIHDNIPPMGCNNTVSWLMCCHVNANRDLRGHKQKMRKNTLKLGKNAKNRLKLKGKAEVLAQENFQK